MEIALGIKDEAARISASESGRMDESAGEGEKGEGRSTNHHGHRIFCRQ